MLTNLGSSLLARFEQLHNLSDLNNSVLMNEQAVNLTPDGHPGKPSKLNNLANAHFCRLEHLGDLNELQKTRVHYTTAAHLITGPSYIRFLTASMWARCAGIDDHSSLLDAYGVVLSILPEFAWLGLSITDRHHRIVKAGSIVRDAAASAIAAGQLKKAVEWLEQGRSIIWGQLLNLRTPVDVLQQQHPKLASDLISLSVQLEGATTRRNISEATISGNYNSPQAIAQQAHENAHKRIKLLKEIRELQGFEQFLLPKTISELSAAAQKGHVVLLIFSRISCDALILLPGCDGKVIHVPLVDFTPKHVETLSKSFETLVPSSGRSDRLYGKREGSLSSEMEFARILSELWMGLVKPILDALAITVSLISQSTHNYFYQPFL
jgi:hypothetical protein